MGFFEFYNLVVFFLKVHFYTNTCALICHEGRECLDLVSTHVQGVPYASLTGTPVVGVLSPIPIDHLVGTVVSEKRKVDLEHVSARLNDLEDAVCLLDLLLPGGPHSLHVLVDKYVL